MTPDTPLPEVCAHLPVDAARLLLSAAPATSSVTLMAVRQLLCELEENNSHLDPITMEIVLNNFVLHIASLHSMVIVATTQPPRE